MEPIEGVYLPEEYGEWELTGTDIEFTDSGEARGVICYERSITDTTSFSIYLEDDGDEWGGALIDTSPPENPHRDPLDSFYAETLDEALEQMMEYMETDIERYMG